MGLAQLVERSMCHDTGEVGGSRPSTHTKLYLFSSVWLERDSVHDGLVPTLRKSLVPVHKALRRKHATKIEDGGSNPSRGASILQEGHYPTRRSVAQ